MGFPEAINMALALATGVKRDKKCPLLSDLEALLRLKVHGKQGGFHMVN